ncbi:hypothetical protein QUF74_18765 [Candidatus Halobeggiatoa sp. HSG11]|nr:hypothetical protein [Candidatus Halobeggiatoa sp. HSG11]
MLNTLLTLLLISTPQSAIEQSQPAEQEELTGTIIQKPWSKSQESYCIGGSEYFVLQYGEDLTIVLKHAEDNKIFSDFIDKQVVLEGYKQTNIVTPSDRSSKNGISQTLVNPVSCTFFMVQNIK